MQAVKNSGYFSLITIFVFLLVVSTFVIIRKDYQNPAKIIESDAINYYAFLPALIIENDLSFKFAKEEPSKYSMHYWLFRLENGNMVSKVTIGMSIMYAPFFLIAHAYATLFGFESDGFSTPYRLAIIIAALVYTIIALVLLRNMLKKFIPDYFIAIGLFSVVLGTNLFHYVGREAGMSHAYSFFVIVLFIYLIDKFYNKPSFRISFWLGIVYGLILLIRPTNGFIGMILPLWALKDKKDLASRLKFWFRTDYKFVIVFLVGTLLMLFPQLIYWKVITGNFIYNGYEGGIHFHFSNPQIINSLFSYRKGWLLYTPVMILVLPGFYFMYKSYKVFFWGPFIVFLCSVYINSSWWLWWFGAGYGNRGYVDFYGLYAFPLVIFLFKISTLMGKIGKPVITFFAIIFVFHNLFQVMQYNNGAIHLSAMTKEAYWFSFGKLYPKKALYTLLIEPDKKLAAKGIYPKPLVKSKTREEWIQFYENGFRNNPEFIQLIGNKALKFDIPMDTMLRRDAIFCFNKDFNTFFIRNFIATNE